MSAYAKRPYLAIIAGFLILGMMAGPAAAQTPASGTDRVAKRYSAATQPAAAAAAPTDPGLETKIDKIPLPDFVKQKQTDPAVTQAAGQSAAAMTADAQAFDMPQSVQRGLDANPQMQSARAVLSGSEESRRQALANFGPVGTVSYAFQRTDAKVVGSTSLSLIDNQLINKVAGTSLATTRTASTRQGYRALPAAGLPVFDPRTLAVFHLAHADPQEFVDILDAELSAMASLFAP